MDTDRYGWVRMGTDRFLLRQGYGGQDEEGVGNFDEVTISRLPPAHSTGTGDCQPEAGVSRPLRRRARRSGRKLGGSAVRPPSPALCGGGDFAAVPHKSFRFFSLRTGNRVYFVLSYPVVKSGMFFRMRGQLDDSDRGARIWISRSAS